MTDTNDTTTRDRRTTTKPTWDDGESMTMGEMDHTPPVEGIRRVFERKNEGPARPDGGQTAPQDDEAPTDDDEQFTQQMREMDHTPPVDGPNRTFERGKENTDVAK